MTLRQNQSLNFEPQLDKRTHIHCITNSIAQTFTANCLLASNIFPSMTSSKEEVSDFVKKSDGLLINLGALTIERQEVARVAIDVANAFNIPWALDPVKIHISPLRAAFAKELLSYSPRLIRANKHEANVLFDGELQTKQLKVITGKDDIITGKNLAYSIANGHPWMDKVTAMGCALTPFLLGHLVINSQRDQSEQQQDEEVLAYSVAKFGLAGERAAEKANGPGTFVPHFIDELANLSKHSIDDLSDALKITALL